MRCWQAQGCEKQLNKSTNELKVIFIPTVLIFIYGKVEKNKKKKHSRFVQYASLEVAVLSSLSYFHMRKHCWDQLNLALAQNVRKKKRPSIWDITEISVSSVSYKRCYKFAKFRHRFSTSVLHFMQFHYERFASSQTQN